MKKLKISKAKGIDPAPSKVAREDIEVLPAPLNDPAANEAWKDFRKEMEVRSVFLDEIEGVDNQRILENRMKIAFCYGFIAGGG